MRRWEKWEEVLLGELLSELNIVQTQEGFFFFVSNFSYNAIWDNQSGLLSMLGCDHVIKLCKDLGKGVDSVFDPNTQRFGPSLEVRHMFSYPLSSPHSSVGGPW